MYLLCKRSGQPEIFNKFAYGVLPEYVRTLAALFTIDIQVIHGLTV
jgi:hypothetical protein